MRCPLCQTELPDGANQCTRCDWTAPVETPTHTEDWIAAGLSIVPGVGHLYKGHLVPGILLLCLWGPLYLLFVFWLVPKTYGASLLLPAVFVFLTGQRAYHLRTVAHSRVMEEALGTLRRWQERLHWGGSQ